MSTWLYQRLCVHTHRIFVVVARDVSQYQLMTHTVGYFSTILVLIFSKKSELQKEQIRRKFKQTGRSEKLEVVFFF